MKLYIKADRDPQLMTWVPKEFKKYVVDIYKGEREWNERTKRWNTLICIDWENGEHSEFQTLSFMPQVLREFHSPDEYSN